MPIVPKPPEPKKPAAAPETEGTQLSRHGPDATRDTLTDTAPAAGEPQGKPQPSNRPLTGPAAGGPPARPAPNVPAKQEATSRDFERIPYLAGHEPAANAAAEVVASVTLEGGGNGDGAWRVAGPLPQSLAANGSDYDLADRATGRYTFRHR